MLLDDASSAKLYVTSRMLQLRRDQAALFANGAYQPLQVEGERKEHVFAFARVLNGASCIVVVPRCTARLMGGVADMPLGEPVWGDARINVGECSPATMLFTGANVAVEETVEGRWVRVAELFAEFPVAVLAG